MLYCKRHEWQRACQNLTNQGIVCFCPMVNIHKVSRGKRQERREPLFPSYVFICFDHEIGPSFTAVRSTRGVIDFVRVGGEPKKVLPELIDILKLREAMDEAQDLLPEKGTLVTIKSGSLAHVEAIFQEWDGVYRSLLLIRLLEQWVPVRMNNQDLCI